MVVWIFLCIFALEINYHIRDRGILKKIQTAWWFGFFYVSLPSKSIIILKPLKNETT